MTDTQEILTCPACGEEMKKIYMPDAGINIDLCLNGCGGMFFDNREFDKFDEPDENINNLIEIIGDKIFKSVDTSEIRTCPICGVPMVKMGTGIVGVEIDYCNNCATKFLDNGELLKIREGSEEDYFKNKIDMLLDYVYKENLDKATYNMSTNKTSYGRKLVENIMVELLVPKNPKPSELFISNKQKGE